jgi:hypothetical protein
MTGKEEKVMTNYCHIEVINFEWVLAPIDFDYDDVFTSTAYGGEYIVEANNSRPYY